MISALPSVARAQGDVDGVAPPIIDNVEAAFAAISVNGRHLTASTNGRIPEPAYRVSFKNRFGTTWTSRHHATRAGGDADGVVTVASIQDTCPADFASHAGRPGILNMWR